MVKRKIEMCGLKLLRDYRMFDFYRMFVRVRNR